MQTTQQLSSPTSSDDGVCLPGASDDDELTPTQLDGSISSSAEVPVVHPPSGVPPPPPLPVDFLRACGKAIQSDSASIVLPPKRSPPTTRAVCRRLKNVRLAVFGVCCRYKREFFYVCEVRSCASFFRDAEVSQTETDECPEVHAD